MSTKGLKKSSNGKKRTKKDKSSKGKPKVSDASTPRKIKPKSKVIKPKSEVLNKKKKKKSKTSTPKKADMKLRKKKVSKPRKSTLDPIKGDNTENDPKINNKPKRRRRKNSAKIESLKRQFLKSDQNKENILPSSAKKIMISPPKNKKKQISQVQSLKKSKNSQYSNGGNQRRAISDMYGFGKKQKKKKTKDFIQPKIGKKQKKRNTSDFKRKKKKTTEIQPKIVHKMKKKPVQPSLTEKLSLFRRKTKTKTKKKQLLAIGDYVSLDGSNHKCGVIRYKGSLRNVTGVWYGIELLGKDKNGDCDGLFNDERYFKCKGDHGIFVMYPSIECKMNSAEIEKILKKKVGKKRANTLTLSQTLANKMTLFPKKDKRKSNKAKKDKKKSKAKTRVFDEKGKDKKANKKVRKVKKNKIFSKKMSNTMDCSDKDSNEGKTEQKSRFKWDIPSERSAPQLQASVSTSNHSNVSSPSPSPSSVSNICLTPKTATTIGARVSVFGRSDNALNAIHLRGRKLSNSESDQTKRRTRSLSVKRSDKSWMKNDQSISSERIKQNIAQKKALDLQGLMAHKGGKKKKEIIGKLFEKHITEAKVIAAKGGGPDTIDKSKLKDRLKDEEEALMNAVEIVKDLGFLKYIKDDHIYSKIYIKKYRKKERDLCDEKTEELDFDMFDMNNIDILSRFEEKTRAVLSKVICQAIISVPSIEILEMCNCDIDCDFMEILCEYLSAYYSHNQGSQACITVLSLQSNPIMDRGMVALTNILRLNNRNLNTIKLQNNRKDISTLICQQICESLQSNKFITKFEMEFRHYQWRDFRDRVVKENAERARLNRLEMKKTLSV